MNPRILVTGDIVLDCHFYGGVTPMPSSYGGLGANYTERLGGAVLSHVMLAAATAGKAKAWDKARKKWEEENLKLTKQGKALRPWPEGMPKNRPKIDVRMGLKTANLKAELPDRLRSYGVWTEHLGKDGQNGIWRVSQSFGYGPASVFKPTDIFQFKTREPKHPPALTFIDDGGISFRHETAESAWPEFSRNSPGYFVLKTSAPLCRGELWPALKPVMDRLFVVVSVDDLRRDDCHINGRLTWELTVEQTVAALCNNPVAGELLAAAHVIINFGSEGALWIRQTGKRSHHARLFFRPSELEGQHARQIKGSAYGFQTCLAVGLAYQLVYRHTTARQIKGPGPFDNGLALESAVHAGISAGLLAQRRLLEVGHVPVSDGRPGFPLVVLGDLLTRTHGGYVAVDVPFPAVRGTGGEWTILKQSEKALGSAIPLTAAALKLHLERLAQAEHLGWCAERTANGWTFAEVRDNNLKRHNLLVDWSGLGPADQDKDRSSIRAIPDWLDEAGLKAIPVKSVSIQTPQARPTRKKM